VIEGREHLAKLMKLEPFESCIQRWRFDGQGNHTVTLIGGNAVGPHWIIGVGSACWWPTRVGANPEPYGARHRMCPLVLV
jgi:hypothetical protein